MQQQVLLGFSLAPPSHQLLLMCNISTVRATMTGKVGPVMQQRGSSAEAVLCGGYSSMATGSGHARKTRSYSGIGLPLTKRVCC